MHTVIHWFRRDLRLTDNTALHAASRDGARVVPVFILSKWTTSHSWTGANRQAFLCDSLRSLDANLRAIGARLIVREGDAVEELCRLAAETGATEIFFNRDPDPWGRSVEDRLAKVAAQGSLRCRAFKDVAIHERQEVLTGAGEPFRVFTPYSRAWAKLSKPLVLPAVKTLPAVPETASLELPDLSRWNLPPAGGGILPGGEKAARERLKDFLARRSVHYADHRDLPAVPGTSRLSQDLRFGLLSPREVHRKCLDAADQADATGRGSLMKFIAEIVWREFYMQILWNFPLVLEHEFNPKFRGMTWPGDHSRLAPWANGETGFPIVDAAMRELRETGFMHNRCRMITAMFLTKDLHLDWRLGERHFMQFLTDGEIASNNGGWQWSAGTGADAAPYFRIQNPWSQTLRYDPQGAYIKKWIPALRDVPAKRLCEPPAPGTRLARDYPPPIVDHAAARDRTLALFKSVANR